jgi:hypothetical protein
MFLIYRSVYRLIFSWVLFKIQILNENNKLIGFHSLWRWVLFKIQILNEKQ